MPSFERGREKPTRLVRSSICNQAGVPNLRNCVYTCLDEPLKRSGMQLPTVGVINNETPHLDCRRRLNVLHWN